MPSDIFPNVKQLSDEELLRQRKINEQKAKERNARIAESVNNVIEGINTRSAQGQEANREGVKQFGNDVLSTAGKIGNFGKDLYNLTFGIMNEQPEQQQPIQQPQSVTQPAPVQTQPQVVTQPTQPVFVTPRQAQPRPVQRQVATPSQPVQQQQVDPNIITDMVNAYTSPDYEESTANSSPVAQEADAQVAEQLEQSEPSGKQSVVSDILGKIKEGYNENRDNGFAVENLQGDPTKTGWNRFGEALGTTARMAGNPLVQGILAGAIKGKTSGDWGEGLEYGINYAQNKAKSDAYEKMMGRRPSILGGYGTDDYKASVDAAYKQGNLDINRQKANDYSRRTDAEIDYKLQMLGIKKEELAHRIANDKEKLKLESRRLGVSEARLKAYVNDLDWKHKNGGKTAKQNADMANQRFKNAMTYINTLPEGEEKEAAYKEAYQDYEDAMKFLYDDDIEVH